MAPIKIFKSKSFFITNESNNINKAFPLICLSFLLGFNVFAQQPATTPQAQQKWNTNGNSATGTEFIGTTNNTSLVFKTNSSKAFEINPSGDVFMTKFSGNGAGMVRYGSDGKIDRVPFNNSFTQVLSSSGVWKEISTFTGLEVTNNNIIQTATGNFGIGTNNPQTKLEVNGDAFINGNFKTSGDITFAGNQSIAYTPASGGTPAIYAIGPIGIGNRPLPLCLSGIPPTSSLYQYHGMIQSYGMNTAGIPITMSMGFDGSNGIVDLAGNAPSRLLINYYCGKDVFMCTGSSGGNVIMTTSTIGKVGIGIDNPTEKLEIANGNIFVKGNGNFNAANNEAYIFLGDHNHSIEAAFGKGVIINTMGVTNGIFLQQGTGNVGIGTDLQSNSFDNVNDYFKLSVNGNIRAKEIVVQSDWADFVFAPAYKLMSLENVEKFIKINNHLPDVPSAKDISSNGLKVAETQTVMMQKIEELTLYIIEQNKKLTELQNKIAKIEEAK